MGMTRWQMLARVQIPLVLPVIAAGVRTSGVQIAATTPIAGLIGGRGYGDFISFALSFPIFSATALPPLLIGAVGVAVLALVMEIGLGAVQRAVTPAGLRLRDTVETPETGGGTPAQRGGALAAA